MQSTVEGLIDVFGVMAPHASVECCGRVSDALWASVDVPDHVLVIGPNHTGLGSAAAVAWNMTWTTAHGVVGIDRETSRELVDACPLLELDDTAHREEHSITAVLPYIFAANPGARVTALCLRSMSFADCAKVAAGVAAVVAAAAGRGRRILVVASSDLNHNEPLRIGMRKDRMALDRIADMDAPGLYQAVVDHHISMCGMVPVVVMILASRERGAGYAELLEYGTSMDFTGDASSVVGYGAVVLMRRCPTGRLRRLDQGSGQ